MQIDETVERLFNDLDVDDDGQLVFFSAKNSRMVI